MFLLLLTCFSSSPFSFVPCRIALCCCSVLFWCWSLPALLGKQLCLGSSIAPVFSPRQTGEVKYCCSANEHHISLKAELTKDILMFPRTSKVMLSVTSISRKCLCSGLSACVLMAVHVLFKLLSVSVLGTAAPIFFSAIQFLRQAYQWGIWGMALKWNKKTNPKLLSKVPSKKS